MKAFCFFLYRSNDLFSRSEVLLADDSADAKAKIGLVHNNWLLIPWCSKQEEDRWFKILSNNL